MRVLIPNPLRSYTANAAAVDALGKTLDELTKDLDRHYPGMRFRVIEELPRAPQLPPVTLFAALIKFDKFEWLVEKATELGVARIVPVEAARSEAGLLAAALPERLARRLRRALRNVTRIRARTPSAFPLAVHASGPATNTPPRSWDCTGW